MRLLSAQVFGLFFDFLFERFLCGRRRRYFSDASPVTHQKGIIDPSDLVICQSLQLCFDGGLVLLEVEVAEMTAVI